MSPEITQLLGVLLALAPWIAFAGAVAWAFAHEVRDGLRTTRLERDDPESRDEQVQSQATNTA